MTRFRLSLILVVALTALLGGVTGAGASRAGGARAPEEPAAHGARAQAPAEPGAEEDCSPFAEFDAANFNDSTEIDNTFLPLKPGTRRVLRASRNRGGGPLDHTVTFTVTDVVKVIDGVRTLAVWDVDENAGELAEEELAFLAQDDEGNIWNLGEYPEEFEGGEFAGAPSTWIHGIEDAEGGVHMPARARGSATTTCQGDAPSIEFLDCAFVFEKGLSVCVPFGCFEGVLVTHERSPLDPAGGDPDEGARARRGDRGDRRHRRPGGRDARARGVRRARRGRAAGGARQRAPARRARLREQRDATPRRAGDRSADGRRRRRRSR